MLKFFISVLFLIFLTNIAIGCDRCSEQATQTAAVSSNEEPAAGLRKLLPETLIDNKGDEVSLSALDGKIIGLYFSAEWCPPCRQFTPELVRFRERHQDDFEVVFISSDRTAADQMKYMKGYNMDWPAVPFDAAQRVALGRHFGVRGIPALIIIDSQGNLLSRNGRAEVTGSRQALRDWQSKVSN